MGLTIFGSSTLPTDNACSVKRRRRAAVKSLRTTAAAERLRGAECFSRLLDARHLAKTFPRKRLRSFQAERFEPCPHGGLQGSGAAVRAGRDVHEVRGLDHSDLVPDTARDDERVAGAECNGGLGAD